MRRLLGVLSDAELEPDLAPQPSLADLDALVATYRTAGLPVDMERSGTASLDGAAQLVVYRVVQEGLTNVLRYARTPSRVLVRLRLAEEVEVEVVDDGLGSGQQPSVGLGRGLIGLRERAAMYGAEVEAGPRAEIGGHGWRLRFRFAPQAARTGGRDE
jgi:signal transduction histidine kinase